MRPQNITPVMRHVRGDLRIFSTVPIYLLWVDQYSTEMSNLLTGADIISVLTNIASHISTGINTINGRFVFEYYNDCAQPCSYSSHFGDSLRADAHYAARARMLCLSVRG